MLNDKEIAWKKGAEGYQRLTLRSLASLQEADPDWARVDASGYKPSTSNPSARRRRVVRGY